MSEFKIGNSTKRANRRICTKCRAHAGERERCGKCGGKTAARIQISYTISGNRQRILTDAWEESEASKILQQIEDDYWRRQRSGAKREIGGHLGPLLDDFLEAKSGESKNYQKQLRTATGALRRGIGESELVQLIAHEDILSFRDEGLESGLSAATVRSYLIAIRQFFTWCVERGVLRQDPSERVKLPAPKARGDFLRPEEVGPVLESFGRYAPNLKPIMAAITLGGFRKGEIINLRRKDVDLQARWAYVTEFEGDEIADQWAPKTASSKRAVPLHPLVAAELASMKPVLCPDGSLSPWMFPVIDGRKSTRQVDSRGRAQPVVGDRRSPETSFFGSKLKVCLQAAGVNRRVTVHGLRRSFAVLLTQVGAPDSIIRQALGHSAKGVTEFNYLPRRDALLQEWIDKIRIGV